MLRGSTVSICPVPHPSIYTVAASIVSETCRTLGVQPSSPVSSERRKCRHMWRERESVCVCVWGGGGGYGFILRQLWSMNHISLKKDVRCYGDVFIAMLRKPHVAQDVYRPLPGLRSCWGDYRLTVLQTSDVRINSSCVFDRTTSSLKEPVFYHLSTSCPILDWLLYSRGR